MTNVVYVDPNNGNNSNGQLNNPEAPFKNYDSAIASIKCNNNPSETNKWVVKLLRV